MRLGYDPKKNDRNISERGLSFEQVADLNWPTAIIRPDARKDYGEERFNMLAKVQGRVFHITFTKRGGVTWIISARKANKREQRRYEKS